MAEAYEYLIGGIICLIISVVASIMQNKFSAPSLVGLGLFFYGVYKAIKARKQERGIMGRYEPIKKRQNA